MSEQISPPSAFRSGIKFGLGFSIPFLALYVIAGASVSVISQQLSQRYISKTFKTFGPQAGLKIDWHKPDRRSSLNLLVLGQLSNAGADTWDWVRLQVDLYDKSDQLVGVCKGQCTGPLHPGESRSFSIDCGGTGNDPLPIYERYTLAIVDASYKAPTESGSDGA